MYPQDIHLAYFDDLLYSWVQVMTLKWYGLYLHFRQAEFLSSWFYGVVQCSKDSIELKIKTIGFQKVEI